MTFGSLFAGVGGMDLGFERAGMECRWQVEINTFARSILERHWPNVRRHDDVRTFPPDDPDDWRVDVIAGGFPCQDVSVIGKRAGIEGDRSGLWEEFRRIVGVLRPRYVVVENTPGLLSGGFGRVLGDLAAIGYNAEWQTFPAAAVGAIHVRDRVWIVAYPGRERLQEGLPGGPEAAATQRTGGAGPSLDPVRVLRELHLHDPRDARPRMRVSPGRGLVCESLRRGPAGVRDESPVCRVGGRVPHRVDRIRTIGNAVMPDVAEWVGHRIVESDSR